MADHDEVLERAFAPYRRLRWALVGLFVLFALLMGVGFILTAILEQP